ncbi:hypothetical protein ACWC3X_36285 [Streptomyces populi]
MSEPPAPRPTSRGRGVSFRLVEQRLQPLKSADEQRDAWCWITKTSRPAKKDRPNPARRELPPDVLQAAAAARGALKKTHAHNRPPPGPAWNSNSAPHSPA